MDVEKLSLSQEIDDSKMCLALAHKKRLGRYALAKAHQYEIQGFMKATRPGQYKKELKGMSSCSENLIFRNYKESERYRLVGGVTCQRHLLCAMCALRRSSRMAMEVAHKVKFFLENNPDVVPLLLTITVKDMEDLKAGWNHLKRSRRRFADRRRSSIHAKGNGLKKLSVSRFILGGIGSFEFKRGKNSGLWHPHVHELVFVKKDRFIYTEEKRGKNKYLVPRAFKFAISEEWLKITGDSYIVDVCQIQDQSKEGGLSIIGACCEVAKYALKMNALQYEDQLNAYDILKGQRLSFSYGCLRNMKIPDDYNLDPLGDEQGGYVDLVYSYYRDCYNLVGFTDIGDVDGRSRPTGSGFDKRKKSRHDSEAEYFKYSDAVKEYMKKVDFYEK